MRTGQIQMMKMVLPMEMMLLRMELAMAPNNSLVLQLLSLRTVTVMVTQKSIVTLSLLPLLPRVIRSGVPVCLRMCCRLPRRVPQQQLPLQLLSLLLRRRQLSLVAPPALPCLQLDSLGIRTWASRP